MADTKKDDAPQTVAGYAGKPSTDPQKLPKDAPEGTVMGEGGIITKPTEVTVAPVSYKKANDEDKIFGRSLLEGDTFNGFHRKIIVDLTQAVTQEGAYNVFKGHYPDAIRDGFKAKNVTEDEAEKLQEDWKKEGAIPNHIPEPETPKK